MPPPLPPVNPHTSGVLLRAASASGVVRAATVAGDADAEHTPRAPTLHDARCKTRRGWRRRPDVWSVKTRHTQWQGVYSRWRYVHGLLFAVGPPLHLLRRIALPLVVDSAVFGFVAADHIVQSVTAARGTKMTLLPPLSASVIANLTPMFQLSLLAVSLMLTLRLGRVYDRWLESRKQLSVCANWVVMASQRAAEWGDVQRADAVARWSAAWLWTMVDWLGDRPTPAPALDVLLARRDRAALAAARKPRALAATQLCRLLGTKAAIADFMMDKLSDQISLLEATKRQGLPSGVANLSTGFILFWTGLFPLVALPITSAGPHDTDLESVLFTLALSYFLYIVIAVLFLGADELANAMEDPFYHIPLTDIAAGATRDIAEALHVCTSLPPIDGGDAATLLPGTDAVWEAAVQAATATATTTAESRGGDDGTQHEDGGRAAKVV